jgi:hypothetical protein
MVVTRIVVSLALCSLVSAAQTKPSGKTLRGWLSDSRCARARASGSHGVYTATNPDCAKQCVGEGAKIVLILPAEKKVVDIANQSIASEHIGDRVEVTGTFNASAQIFHIDSLKLLEIGAPHCDYPKSKQ